MDNIKKEGGTSPLETPGNANKTQVRRGAHFKPAATEAVEPLRVISKDNTRDEKNVHPAKTAAKVALGIVGAAGAVYLGGVLLWSNVFLPNTMLNGKDVSLKSTSAVAQALEQRFAQLTVHASGDEVDFDVTAADFDFRVDASALASQAIGEIDPWRWPLELADSRSLNVQPTSGFDQEKLDSLVAQNLANANEGATQPSNAAAAFDDEADRFVVVPEVYGTAIDNQVAAQLIVEAFVSDKPTVDLNDALLKPSIVEDTPDLVTAVETANKYALATQTLTANGETVLEVTSTQIARFVSISDDLRTVELDTAGLADWTKSDLEPQLDTANRDRTFQAPDGRTVSVGNSHYGWICDTVGLSTALAEAIQSGEAGSLEVPWKSTANTWNPGGNEWGNRYIDIDLTEQYARMFDDSGNLIWESYIVSGDPTTDHATPTGVYVVNDHKGRDQKLKGLDEDKDGEPDYESDVTYWIPFVGNMIAMHDADWRYYFGGTIYWGNGSHGCINLPVDAAAQMYDLSQIGDVVVVHS